MDRQAFYFAFDFSTTGFKPGAHVDYYFEVFDNDAVNGSKKTESQKSIFQIPDLKHIYDLAETVQDSIKIKIEKGIELSRSIQKNILRVQKNTLQGSSTEWEQQQLLQQISSEQQQLDDLLKEIRSPSTSVAKMRSVEFCRIHCK
jgi:hypothetical protein